MIVADNSAIVAFLLGPAEMPHFDALLQRHTVTAAPELIDVELLSALSRLERYSEITTERARDAVADFLKMPVKRYSVSGLMQQIWELRHNFTAYDAAYVALARALNVELVTRDGKLARAAARLIHVIHV